MSGLPSQTAYTAMAKQRAEEAQVSRAAAVLAYVTAAHAKTRHGTSGISVLGNVAGQCRTGFTRMLEKLYSTVELFYSNVKAVSPAAGNASPSTEIPSRFSEIVSRFWFYHCAGYNCYSPITCFWYVLKAFYKYNFIYFTICTHDGHDMTMCIHIVSRGRSILK